MENPTPLRSLTERADHTRARILEAAIRQFGENGLAGARTEQIAEAAGVNKALLYYYFKSKEALYVAAIEAVAEGVQTASMAMLDADSSAGERFLRIVLSNFDRTHAFPAFQGLMQQEMIRMHRGEANALQLLAQKLVGPLWLRLRVLIEEGAAAGELIRAEWTQMIYSALGANLFYYLSAPLIGPALEFNPLEPAALSFRRKSAIEYLGQAIFVDREYGARVAAQVLATTPMPEPADLSRHVNVRNCNIEAPQTSATEARHN